MSMALKNMRAEDDGLTCPEVGGWAEEKYRLISLYDELFSTAMKNKWGKRVYIDLYSGAGHSRIRNTRIHLIGSPILALSVPYPFDKYIFCEGDPDKLTALRKRGEKISTSADVVYIEGSCDNRVESICNEIPNASFQRTVLSLCVVDPFDFGFKFETIRRLSQSRVDFLVLLAVWMDANRGYEHYVDGGNKKLDEALGNALWRERWSAKPRPRDEFPNFVANEFALSMSNLGYMKCGLDKMKLVRSNERNLPLYYLALFSRHVRAYQLWDQVLKYGTAQMGLSFGGE
ncbi:MAG TPA: three-Cys-motif partner protein TcmP [Terracidiphilus sp.]|nr:three-Cys-motif partner protein TcmP [Terracidiphilus sp.]